MKRLIVLALTLCVLSAAALANAPASTSKTAPPLPNPTGPGSVNEPNGRVGRGPGGPGGPGDPPPAPPQQDALTIQCIIVSFNYNNRGQTEGMCVRAQGQVGQINFPNELADAIMKAINVGDTVDATMVAEAGPPGRGARGPGPDGNMPPAEPQPDHAVYRLVSVRTAKGQVIADLGPGDRKSGHAEGNITVYNFDRRGTPNGVQLSTGDIVHIDPHNAAQFNLTPGTPLSADGPATPLPNGHLYIEAQQINGTQVLAGPGGPGRGPADAPPPPANGNAQPLP